MEASHTCARFFARRGVRKKKNEKMKKTRLLVSKKNQLIGGSPLVHMFEASLFSREFNHHAAKQDSEITRTANGHSLSKHLTMGEPHHENSCSRYLLNHTCAQGGGRGDPPLADFYDPPPEKFRKIDFFLLFSCFFHFYPPPDKNTRAHVCRQPKFY